MRLLLNMGGPDRVSRVEMAETVAYVRGYNKSLIKSVSASSVCGFKIPFVNNINEHVLFFQPPVPKFVLMISINL